MGGDSGCSAGGSQDTLLDTSQGHWHQQIKELSLQSLPWIFFPVNIKILLCSLC